MRRSLAASVQRELESHPWREGIDVVGERVAVGEEHLGADLHRRERWPEGEAALLDLEPGLRWGGVNLAVIEHDERFGARLTMRIKEQDLDRHLGARRRFCDDERGNEDGGDHKIIMVSRSLRRVSAGMGVVMGPQYEQPRLLRMSLGELLLSGCLVCFGAALSADEALLMQLYVSPPQVTTALAYRTYVAPEYPREAWRRGLEGWVDVELTIGPDGRVLDAKVLASQPRGIFERAALRAVMQWVFDPSATGEARRTGVFRVDFKRGDG